MTLKVLYIHHIGIFGGSSRSLIELIKAFPAGSIEPLLISPQGEIKYHFKKQNIPTITTSGISKFDNTKYSYYKRARWILLLREFYYVFFTVAALLRAKIKWRNIDLIHINEITCLPTLIFSKLIFKKPVILHARAVQAKNINPLREMVISRIINKFTDTIIAIDMTVKHSLPDNPRIYVIHNGFRSDELTNGENNNNEIRTSVKDKPDDLKVAIVGNILKFKGVYEFAQAAKICKQRNIKAQFFIVGATGKSPKKYKGLLLKKAGFSHYIEDEISSFIENNDLCGYLYLIKFTTDIYNIYKNIDIICFPSHLNAVGRPVIEAAFFKVPSIVAIRDPFEDTIVDGETGICIEEKNPKALADAIQYFYLKPGEIKRMGDAAFQLALTNFDTEKNAKKILSIYKELYDKNN